MKRRIEYIDGIKKDLKRIGITEAKRIIKKIDKMLPEYAESYPFLSGEFSEYRKFRVGDYRVFYWINGDVVKVERIRGRKDAYR